MVTRSNDKKGLRRGALTCMALATSVSMLTSPALAGAQAIETDPVAIIFEQMDQPTKDLLGGAMADAMKPMLDALNQSVTQVDVSEKDGTTSVTWLLDTGDLSKSLGGVGSSVDKELAMVSLPKGVVSSGDVKVHKVSYDDSGELIRTEMPVSNFGDIDDATEVAMAPIATVHKMTDPQAVAAYGEILRGLATTGSVESLAPLADQVATSAGVELDEETLGEITSGKAQAMVPYIMAMQNVLTGENPLDVLLGSPTVPTVERANLFVDVAPGDKLEITVSGDADVADTPVTTLMPQSMLGGANSTLNALGEATKNVPELPTIPQLPTLPGMEVPPLPTIPEIPGLTKPVSNVTAPGAQPAEFTFSDAPGAQPAEFSFADGPGAAAGPQFVQTQDIGGLVDPGMISDLIGAIDFDTLQDLTGNLFGIVGDLDTEGLEKIFGTIVSGGELEQGALPIAMLNVIVELAQGILPALGEAIKDADLTKLTDFIRETIENGGVPGGDLSGVGGEGNGGTGEGNGDDTDDEDGGTGGTGGGGGSADGADDSVGDKLTVNEAFEVYDLVAAKIDERSSGSSSNTSTSSSSGETGVSGTNPGAGGASSPDRSSDSSSDGSSSTLSDSTTNQASQSPEESVNYNAAAQDQLPVTGASRGVVLLTMLSLVGLAAVGLYRHNLGRQGA